MTPETTQTVQTVQTVAVNWSDFQVRNGHARKAVAALRDSGWTFDAETKTWSGTEDYRGGIAHYIGRGTLRVVGVQTCEGTS